MVSHAPRWLRGVHRTFCSQGAANGSLTVKSEPCPSPSLCAVMVPPCSSTRWRAMASPRPRPPWVRVMAPSACLKRSKTESRKLGLDALTVVGDGQRHVAVRLGHGDLHLAPSRRELDGVRQQVPHDLLQAQRIAVTVGQLRWQHLTRARCFFSSSAGLADSMAESMTRESSVRRSSRRMFPEMMRDVSSRSSISRACAIALRSITRKAFSRFDTARPLTQACATSRGWR